ncbi:g7812 [Coccomyxa viridis]|uniref:G7812 protein n=1 Tax=Coccomyxa viridis TaxID=1274662 RepID=A0ABP1G1D5_9CHLO
MTSSLTSPAGDYDFAEQIAFYADKNSRDRLEGMLTAWRGDFASLPPDLIKQQLRLIRSLGVGPNMRSLDELLNTFQDLLTERLQTDAPVDESTERQLDLYCQVVRTLRRAFSAGKITRSDAAVPVKMEPDVHTTKNMAENKKMELIVTMQGLLDRVIDLENQKRLLEEQGGDTAEHGSRITELLDELRAAKLQITECEGELSNVRRQLNECQMQMQRDQDLINAYESRVGNKWLNDAEQITHRNAIRSMPLDDLIKRLRL